MLDYTQSLNMRGRDANRRRRTDLGVGVVHCYRDGAGGDWSDTMNGYTNQATLEAQKQQRELEDLKKRVAMLELEYTSLRQILIRHVGGEIAEPIDASQD